MKKIFFITSVLVISLSAFAQDTYQNAMISDGDLNGTARYVGMGGAMEALGSDLSTISTNPAGLGLFRRNQVTVTGGLQTVGGKKTLDYSRTTGSFDQIAIVFATSVAPDSYVNFGASYHKSKNFDQLLTVTAPLYNASQNKLSYMKNFEGAMDELTYSQLDALYDNGLCGTVEYVGSRPVLVDHFTQYYNASGFYNDKAQRGYIGEYELNLSGNIHNRVYLGLTIGLKDVHYKSESFYSEMLLADDDVTPIGTVSLYDNREITGKGYQIKLGAIVRPIETSPFRIGAYIHTPTWYELTTRNPERPAIYNDTYDRGLYVDTPGEVLDYKLSTPWLFGLSLGHTIDNYLALGLTYEYQNYRYMDNRIVTGGYYDVYDSYTTSSRPDYPMNAHTKESLKGVHTLRLGAELKVCPEVSLRAGYNYVSPKYDVNAYRSSAIPSQGSFVASTADYVNWQSTNRFTFGVGYAKGHVSFDIACKFQTTKGDYYPFMSYYGEKAHPENNCVAKATGVEDKRTQLLFTFGYKF